MPAESDDRRLRLVRHARRSVDPVTGGPILMLPERVIELNASADAVLARCDGARTVDEIAVSVGEEFECDAGQILNDVRALADDLIARRLVEVEM